MCKGAGDRATAAGAAALGALPQSLAAPSPKMGEEGNEEGGGGQREKRGSGEPSPLHLGEASGRRRRAGIAGELSCGPKLGETTGGQPPPKTAGAPESPAPTRPHPDRARSRPVRVLLTLGAPRSSTALTASGPSPAGGGGGGADTRREEKIYIASEGAWPC